MLQHEIIQYKLEQKIKDPQKKRDRGAHGNDAYGRADRVLARGPGYFFKFNPGFFEKRDESFHGFWSFLKGPKALVNIQQYYAKVNILSIRERVYNVDTMKKRVRKGPRYFHGDDLTKTALDRKRRSKSEPWEKKQRAK